MAKVLARGGRVIRRGQRLARDSGGCRTACCGGDCCSSAQYGGTPPFHECGRRPSQVREMCCTEFNVDARRLLQSSFEHAERIEYVLSEGSWEDWCGLFANDPGGFGVPCGPCAVARTVHSRSSGRTDNAYTITRRKSGDAYRQIIESDCAIGLSVPYLETWRDRRDTEGTVTACAGAPAERINPVANTEHTLTGGVAERCVALDGACWPLSTQLPHNDNQAPPFTLANPVLQQASFPIEFMPLQYGQSQTTVVVGNTTTTTTKTRTSQWEGNETDWRETHRGSTIIRTVVAFGTVNQLFDQRVEVSPGRFVRVTATKYVDHSEISVAEESAEYSIAVRQGWLTDCDGTTGPDACEPHPPPNCEPRSVDYIVGEPCEGAPPGLRPHVLPVNNVEACGYSYSGQWCYKFSPMGQRINDPFAINAIVGVDVIRVGYSFPTCCECLDGRPGGCPAAPPIARADWLNGTRDAQGTWGTYEPTIQGRCCCSPGDKFELTIAKSIWTLPGEVETREIVCDPTAPTVACVKTGFRRDAQQVNFGVHLSTQSGFDQTTPAGSTSGPIDCEWGELGGFATSGQMGFGKPHQTEQLHGRTLGLPIPNTDDGTRQTGEGNGWRIKRYNIVVNCQLLDADAEWESLDGSQNVRSHVQWRITRDPAGPCAGGCTPVTLPTPGPAIEPPVSVGGGPRAVFPRGGGGCAGCGGGGGL